ncbi:MAG: aldehyde dehydrogenase (NADP(+)) [Armatimonas sp.]
MSDLHPVLIHGSWRAAEAPTGSFSGVNPATGETLEDRYPISSRADIDAVLAAAEEAAPKLRALTPEAIAAFLEDYAARIEANREAITEAANAETGLPVEPRLNSVELPRTTNQLRLAAKAARERSWTRPIIDTTAGIRSMHEPLGGAALVFGPNNFPFAFNAISGGDFAAAIAARCPVIAKVHTSHPTTSRLMAECAHEAAQAQGMPAGTVQVLYRMDHALATEMILHPAVAAVGFTGSRSAGMTIKHAADSLGKPAYLEMSSVNPVLILPGALKERGEALATEFFTSCTMGAGQFCTNPGLIVLPAGAETEAFIQKATEAFAAAPAPVLPSKGVRDGLVESVEILTEAGATLLAGGKIGPEPGFRFQPSLLRVSAAQFAKDHKLQTEAFGPVSLIVVCENESEWLTVIAALEGNLTGALYTATDNTDDALYQKLTPPLRVKVGRLLNDKMPTGVAVSAAMNHGGPFPATGHPHFTSVGMPISVARYSMLCSYDNVRADRLPLELQDGNPLGIWRSVDGEWTR